MRYYQPDSACFVLRFFEHGTDTVQAGAQLHDEVIAHQAIACSRVTLDFTGVEQVSVAFADEFIGQLVLYYGFFGFNQVIALRGMNADIQRVVHEAVAQRLLAGLE